MTGAGLDAPPAADLLGPSFHRGESHVTETGPLPERPDDLVDVETPAVVDDVEA